MHLINSHYHEDIEVQGDDLLFAVEHLFFTYPDGGEALRDISLTVRRGDRIALVGKNGSGKSTLARHLNGLLPAQSGSIRYQGETADADVRTAMRRDIGILFQDPDNHLFCNSLYEDVAFGPMNQGLAREEVESLVHGCLEAVGLRQLMYKPAHLLSYGQKKRAAFASLLAMRPEVLILDEPTANLDPRQEQIFKELLADFPGTLIIIDHDLLFLYDICERAIVLANGRVHHDYSFRDLVSQQHALREHGLDFTFRFSCCGEDHHHPQPASHRHYHHSHEHGGNALHAPLPDPQPPVLELQHYSFRYPDMSSGVTDVNLIVNTGETIALVGENGAGKSTLAACLLGLNRGEGYFFHKGREVDQKYRRSLWRQVGMVFQNSADQLFCPSCLEEVAFGPRQMQLPAAEVRMRVEEALDSVRLSGYEQRVPLNMSGGERKRLAIAAALSMRPEVLILDEPTASLDPESQELLLEILERLRMTRILITHDMFFIRSLSNRTVVMHQGRIIRDYPTREFLADEHLQAINGLDYTYKNHCLEEIRDLQHNGHHHGPFPHLPPHSHPPRTAD
jgi:energy-coupling factor transporter ATP-binding protein EcfA2